MAKLIDRVLADDLERIGRTLQAGREGMDDYRMVFIHQLEREGLDDPWWMDSPEIFYRKGRRFRRDFGVATDDPRAVKRPASGEDLHDWWFKRSKSYRYFPSTVLRDSTLYSSEWRTVADRDGPTHRDIISIGKYKDNSPPEMMYPPEYAMRPEFVCRPPLGLGHPHCKSVLDLHPADGPDGCILLSVRRTSKWGRVWGWMNLGGLGSPEEHRYWLDPQRDSIVMRWESVMRDEDGKETIKGNHTIEETARSPRGVWYASQVRRKNFTADENGKPFDQVYHLYVDFDVDLPDSLFEPPTPGRIQ